MRDGYIMKSLRKFFRLSNVIGIYSVFISLWYLSWLMVGDRNWWLVLLNRVSVYLFVLGLVLLIVAVLKRRLKLFLPLLLPTVIFILLYYPYLLPKPAKPMRESDVLKVMTYNVLYSNTDYDAIAGVILAYQPDLVALQEVLPDTMDQLVERLANEYPYHFFGTDGDYGTSAVFSRYALVDSYVLDLKAPRPASVVKTEINDKEVVFIAAHLRPYNLWWTQLKDIPATIMERTREQNRQAEIILEQIGEDNEIVIFGCDCNSYETSSTSQMIDQVLDNAARKVGLLLIGNELPGAKQDISLNHIDYVWYRGDIEPIRVYKILNSGGSDHLPVLAAFDYKNISEKE
jgi:vancomycin resistance protein VanJ